MTKLTIKKRFFFVLVTTIFLAALGFVYINKVFLPVTLKNFIIQKMEEFLNRPVSLESLEYSPINTLTLKNLIIYQKQNPQQKLIEIPRVSFSILFIPLLKEHALVIPSLSLDQPFVLLQRDQDGQINIADLLGASNEKKVAEKKSPFLIRQIKINAGELQYHDLSSSSEFLETIKPVNMKAKLELDKTIKFNLTFQIPKRNSDVSVSGDFNPTTKAVYCWMTAQKIQLAQYLSLFLNMPNLSFHGGNIETAKTEIKWDQGSLTTLSDIEIKQLDIRIGGNTNLSGDITLKKMSFAVKDDVRFFNTGIELPSLYLIIDQARDIQIAGHGAINDLKWTKEQIQIQASLDLKKIFSKFGEQKFLETDLASRSLTVSAINGNFLVSGDLTSQSTRLQINDATSLEGKLSVRNVNLSWQNQKLSVTNDLLIENSLLRAPSGLTAKGIIQTPVIKFTFDPQNYKLESVLTLSGYTADLTDSLHFSGNPIIDLSISPQENLPNVTAKITLKDAAFTGVPYFQTIARITGELLLQPDRVETRQLTFVTLNTAATIKGSLSQFNNPLLDGQLTAAKINTADIYPAFKKFLDPYITSVDGSLTDLTASYQGALKPFNEDLLSAETTLNNVKVVSSKIPQPISELNGTLSFSKDLISWNRLRGRYAGQTLLIDGDLTDFSRPTLHTTIETDHLTARTEIKILRKAFRVTKLTGRYYHSRFDLIGDVRLQDDHQPAIDTRADLVINLNDLPFILPTAQKDILQKFSLGGEVSATLLYRGIPSDWTNWDIALNAESSLIKFMGHPLEDVSLQYQQRDQNINKFSLLGMLYGGKLQTTGKADLSQSSLPAEFLITLKDADLRQFQQYHPTKNQHLSGKLIFNSQMNIPLVTPLKVTGRGDFNIYDGLLGQLIPTLDKTYFTDAQGNFIIKDQKIHTDKTYVLSQTAALRVEGWIGFDKQIDLMIYPDYSNLAPKKSQMIIPDPSDILKDVVNIHCTGDLDNKKCAARTSPTDILKKTTDILTDGIGGIGSILGDILNK